MQHTDPELDKLSYLDEEIEVRVRSEQFAIDKGLPETGPNYRKKSGNRFIPNREAIEKSVKGSSHYNPQGKRRIERTYGDEKVIANWKCPENN